MRTKIFGTNFYKEEVTSMYLSNPDAPEGSIIQTVWCLTLEDAMPIILSVIITSAVFSALRKRRECGKK